MIHTYSHTFKFNTPNKKDKTIFNNILSIVEENDKKHFVHYIQYEYLNKDTISSRQVSLNVDRYYYLEIANIAIDDKERRKRLFTLIGKRRFGSNDNKIDSYIFSKDIDVKQVYQCFINNQLKNKKIPILHEAITHTTNNYKASLFDCDDNYFAALKQTNISSRKTFEKTFLVQMSKSNYKKLLLYKTNGLKIDFIFNIIGKLYFKSQKLSKFNFIDEDINTQLIIDKTTSYLKGQALTIDNREIYTYLKQNYSDIERSFYNFLSASMDFINQPNDNCTIFQFVISISEYIDKIKNKNHLEDIVSFLTMLKIFAQEKKISYLVDKNDQDIKDIFIFSLETLSSWNESLNSNSYHYFNKETINLSNSLKHFMDIYFQYYYDYQSLDAKLEEICELTEKYEKPKISAAEFFEDLELDNLVVAELEELEIDMINNLYKDAFEEDVLELSIKFLRSYISMLDQFIEFKEVAYALGLLRNNLMHFDLSKDSQMLMLLFKGIINDLMGWRKNVLVEQVVDDIHYLDKSFYADIAQIDILLNEDSVNESEIEFF